MQSAGTIAAHTVDKVAHEFNHSCTSQSWMQGMDTGQLPLTSNPASSPPLTLHMVYVASYASPLAWPAPRIFSRKEWNKYWIDVKVALGLLMT